jgi:hypothetical protein
MLIIGRQFKKNTAINAARDEKINDSGIWWALRGSNPRHLPCKGSALPAELNAHMSIKSTHIRNSLDYCQRQISANRQKKRPGLSTGPETD